MMAASSPARADTSIDILAGYEVAEIVSLATDDGGHVLLMLSKHQAADEKSFPPVLEILHLDRNGNQATRYRLDADLALRFANSYAGVAGGGAATALPGGDIALYLPDPLADAARPTLASLLRLAPDGRSIGRTGISHPGYASESQRGMSHVALNAQFATAAPDGSVLVVGGYSEQFGTGPSLPWWGRFKPDGTLLAEGKDMQKSGPGVVTKAKIRKRWPIVVARPHRQIRSRAARLFTDRRSGRKPRAGPVAVPGAKRLHGTRAGRGHHQRPLGAGSFLSNHLLLA